mgnify:FL=1
MLKKYLPKILQEYKNNVTINGNSLDRISFVEGSLVPFLTKQIPIETALRISYLVLKTRIYLFYIICDNHPDLAHNDIIIFFKYCEKLIKLIKKENINWIYGIDREGRIIALLLYNVLKKMGLAHGIKLYFIHGTKKGDVTFYSKKQKEMIHGKNVLLVDEAIDSEGTIMGIEKVLTPLVGETGKIIPTAPLIFKNRAELLIKYHAIETGMNFRFIDYWGANINFSGLIYDDKGKVKIGQKDISSVSKDYPTNISLARGFRKSLISLAGVIGVYIKEKDNLF